MQNVDFVSILICIDLAILAIDLSNKLKYVIFELFLL